MLFLKGVNQTGTFTGCGRQGSGMQGRWQFATTSMIEVEVKPGVFNVGRSNDPVGFETCREFDADDRFAVQGTAFRRSGLKMVANILFDK